MNRNILIFGGGGMLAQALRHEFANERVYVYTKKLLNIIDPGEVKRVIEEHRPCIVLNAAAYTDVEHCETFEGQGLALLANGHVVGTLAAVCHMTGTLLVHYSTDYVFNGESTEGYAEDAEGDPINMYGRTKFLGEALLASNNPQHYLLRTSWLFGPGGSHFVGKIREKLDRGEVLKVVDDQIGVPNYTVDLAKATRYVLENALPFGTYHPVSSGSCSWFEFALEIARYTNQWANPQIERVSSKAFPSAVKRPKNSILLNTKLPAGRSWQDALHGYFHSMQ